MSLSAIKATLINAYVSGGFSVPTAYENRHFTPDNTKPWASVYILPSQPSVATLGHNGFDRHDGFLQIDLNYPAGSGDGDILTKADEIAAHFQAGKYFNHLGQSVAIRSTGRSQGRQIEGMFQINLTIYFYAQTVRS